MLRSLRHDNIVTLLEAFRRKQKLASYALTLSQCLRCGQSLLEVSTILSFAHPWFHAVPCV